MPPRRDTDDEHRPADDTPTPADGLDATKAADPVYDHRDQSKDAPPVTQAAVDDTPKE